jgi:hypothetical protein
MKRRTRTRAHIAAVIFTLLTAQTALAFYNPEIGRWANRDPLGEAGSLNQHAFVRNNPIDYLDPFGLKVEIKGPKDFQNKVNECIKALRQSKRGKKLYDGARKSKDVVVIIQPAPDPSGPYSGSPPRGGIGLDPNNPIFVGPQAPVRQYPDELPPYDPKDKKSIAKACACVLGHELGHAFLDLEDAPDGRNVEDVENPIRIELGLPPRKTYRGIPIAW